MTLRNSSGGASASSGRGGIEPAAKKNPKVSQRRLLCFWPSLLIMLDRPPPGAGFQLFDMVINDKTASFKVFIAFIFLQMDRRQLGKRSEPIHPH
jgi:hypothetical protein